VRFIGVRSGAEDQERIPETSLAQNRGLLKHGDRTRGQKELLHQGLEEWLIIYSGVGGSKEKEVFKKELSYAKEDRSTRYQRSCHCQVKVVFPSSKVLTFRWEIPGRMSHVSHPGVGWGEVAGCKLVPCPRLAFCSLINNI